MAVILYQRRRLKRIQVQVRKQMTVKTDLRQPKSWNDRRNSAKINEEQTYEEINMKALKEQRAAHDYQALTFQPKHKECTSCES